MKTSVYVLYIYITHTHRVFSAIKSDARVSHCWFSGEPVLKHVNIGSSEGWQCETQSRVFIQFLLLFYFIIENIVILLFIVMNSAL